MKSLNLFRPAIKAMAMMMVVGSVLFVQSCKDDGENPTFPAPTISLSSSSASGLPGTKVSTVVTVDSPAGGKTLNVAVAPTSAGTISPVTLDGTESQAVTVEFTIPAAAAVGDVFVLTFYSVDNTDQNSNAGTFIVTTSDVADKPVVHVSEDITTDTHWTADNIYVLDKLINVGQDTKDVAGPGNAPSVKNHAVLTIDPGTIIMGATGTPGGGLIVHRQSQIMAVGTATAPIVFTTVIEPGTNRKAGVWAGLVLCGQASNNVQTSTSTGLKGVEELEGAYGGFHGGGDDPNDEDNSGKLKYVRVEFAGYPINPNQEINGITMGSVGSGTEIDYVQVSYSNDDSFEWFGGTVNAKHLIAYKTLDDDFDTDNGFSGQVQFGLAIREPQFADQSGSNGFESDNMALGNADEPFTNATFSNMTIIGGKKEKNSTIDINFQNVAQIRRNSKQDIINSFFTGFPNGVFIDNALGTSSAWAADGSLNVANNVLAGTDGWGANGLGSAASADEQAYFTIAAGSNHPNAPRGNFSFSGSGGFTNGVFVPGTQATINGETGFVWFTDNNLAVLKWSDASIGLSPTVFDPIAATPDFEPTGASLTAGASFDGYEGFETVNYKGAFGSDDWTATGWVNWNPITTDYKKGL